MNTIMPTFIHPPIYGYTHQTGAPTPSEAAHINRINKLRAEIVAAPKQQAVEKVTESDAGWLPPLTYTMNGETSWSFHPLRTGLVIHEVV